MPSFDPTRPFALFDDARPGGSATLFDGLTDTIVATAFDGVAPALAALRSACGALAGFIGFDAGYALEPRLRGLAREAGGDALPLLWFGRFDRRQAVEPGTVARLLGDRRAAATAPVPGITQAAHADAVAAVKALIAAGDIYQANLTFAATVAVHGHPLALYARLRGLAAAPFSALVHTGDAWVLSFSPELFFEQRGAALTTRPMKGTAPRGATRGADDAAAAALAADPKNRAENLMIVDLLRNDLSRVAVPGSVAVPRLFEVERYPSILQMTSTITATARDGVHPADTLAALFPCGSVTGAPKVRAMEIIAGVEPRPRGLYTGSIGWIDGGDASFNVAIRTLVLAGRTAQGRAARATIGLGSGIVADSVAADEWQECLAKGAFLTRAPVPDLIETMRLEDGQVRLLDRHLDRLAASAARLGHRLDADTVRAVLARETGTARLRLLLSPAGAFALQRSPLPAAVPGPVTIAVVPLPVRIDDWRLRHKTTDRAFYDAARAASGAFEVAFVTPDGRLTEGSFTALFVPRDGRLLTPAGPLLPGVLRAALLASGEAVEATLTVADLAGPFFIGNALRGLLPARLAARPATPQ